ncbi:hypothetical protein [Yoonia sp. R2-816]|uniref:hypothetical protein n=1 Tax=Yoonia sp. R2-816 TaxID=3342638 RepID=UPI00372D05C9
MILFLNGCTVPNVTPEIASSVDLLAVTDSQLRPMLRSRAADEVRNAEQELILSGATVYETEDCDDSDEYGLMANCRLRFLADLDSGPVNATQALTALNEMEAYFAILLVLASDEDSNAVRTQAQELAKALNDAAEGKSAALATLAEDAGRRGDAFTATTGFLAGQYRIGALRSLVRRADPVIETQTLIIAAYLDLDGELSAAHSALVDAEEEVVNAQASGDPRRYSEAVESLKTAHFEYQTAQNESPSYVMKLLRQSHGQLLARLTTGGSAQEVLETVTEIESVINVLKEDV